MFSCYNNSKISHDHLQAPNKDKASVRLPPERSIGRKNKQYTTLYRLTALKPSPCRRMNGGRLLPTAEMSAVSQESDKGLSLIHI